MRKSRIILSSLILAAAIIKQGVAAEPNGALGQLMSQHSSPRFEFRQGVAAVINTRAEINTADGGGKSVGKAVLFSAILPGSGQLYAGSLWKGVAFLALEAVALTAHFKYNSDGNDIEDQYEALADAEWNETEYWTWIAQVGNILWSPGQDLADLRTFEQKTFSHFLPENKNQQYYENVGKYNQFLMGWRDFREEIVAGGVFTLDDYSNSQYQGQNLLTISDTRERYTFLRKDSNDDFKLASTFATITLLNHVASALDAGLTVRRRQQEIRAGFGVQGIRDHNKIVPALAVSVTW